MQVMENNRDKLVVIMAGYKDRMDVFFDSNPGMNSRIAHHLDFAPYTLDELMAIGQMMLADALYYLSDQAEAALREQLSVRMRSPGSPTPAACATIWNAPGSGTRTGWPRTQGRAGAGTS